MFGQSVHKRLKQLDIYNKLPSNLTEQSLSGALISIISLLIITILFITEFAEYISVKEVSEMFVDVGQGEQKLQIFMDITFHNLPCDILSLDVQDILGSHHLNVEGQMTKLRVTEGNKIIESINFLNMSQHAGHDHDHAEPLDRDRLKKAFIEKEGCKIVGYIFVNRVPGNFHISSHSYANQIIQILRENNLPTLDLSHTIHQLSFGNQPQMRNVKKKFSSGVLEPLNGVSKIKQAHQRNVGIAYQYYISVVPTSYKELNGRTSEVYQFVANDNDVPTNHLPAVIFRYDLSPVTVRFFQQKQNFFHFIVQLCAIVGGVFTVAGLLDSILHRSVAAILKKAQMNKLH